MESILYIDACVRKNSRTRSLADYVLTKLDGAVTTLRLAEESLPPLNTEALAERERLIAAKELSDAAFRPAAQFAQADMVVVAAPYWDLSFPALLRAYWETIAVCGVTFEYRKGIPHGLCRAQKLFYVTTAGGSIRHNFGFDYVRTLAEEFYSVPEVIFFSAEGLDIHGTDVPSVLAQTRQQIDAYFEGANIQ